MKKGKLELLMQTKYLLRPKTRTTCSRFLRKHADNDNLYIFPNIFQEKCKEMFILLNLPEDKESFQKFVTTNYNAAQSNQHGIMNFNNFKVYYTNTLQSVPQIIDEVMSVFISSGFTAVKIQIRFGVIREGSTIEAGNIEPMSDYT
jgi:hypothetical protein